MNKQDIFKYAQGALFGVVLLLSLYVGSWIVRNKKAIINTVLYPEVVSNLNIEVTYNIKK